MTDKHDNQNTSIKGSEEKSMISIRHLCKEYPNVMLYHFS